MKSILLMFAIIFFFSVIPLLKMDPADFIYYVPSRINLLSDFAQKQTWFQDSTSTKGTFHIFRKYIILKY